MVPVTMPCVQHVSSTLRVGALRPKCRSLRAAGYAKEATHFLAFNMLCLDNNLILTTVKYLDWRVLNYVELGRAYADMKAYKAATKVIEYGITKV